MTTVDYTLPTFWLSALMNGDHSGLDEKDLAAFDAFMSDAITRHGKFSCLGPVDDEGDFCRYHDARAYGVLACDVVDVRFDVDTE